MCDGEGPDALAVMQDRRCRHSKHLQGLAALKGLPVCRSDNEDLGIVEVLGGSDGKVRVCASRLGISWVLGNGQ
jgi:hypothetical protein